jgi:hypothetical protein
MLKDNNMPVVDAISDIIFKTIWTVGVEKVFDKAEDKLLVIVIAMDGDNESDLENVNLQLAYKENLLNGVIKTRREK